MKSRFPTGAAVLLAAGVLWGLPAQAQVDDPDWLPDGSAREAPRRKEQRVPAKGKPRRAASTAARQHAAHIQQERRLDAFVKRRLREAQKLYRARRYEECIAACDEILTYRTRHQVAQRLKFQAENGMQEEELKFEEKKTVHLEKKALAKVTRSSRPPEDKSKLVRPDLPRRPDLRTDEKYQKIEALLNQRIGMHMVDAELDFILTKLFQVSGVNIIADQAILEGKTLTLAVRDMSLREILQFISHNHDDIEFTVSESAVWVTTPESPILKPVVYPLNFGLLTKRQFKLTGGRRQSGGGRGGQRGGNRGTGGIFGGAQTQPGRGAVTQALGGAGGQGGQAQGNEDAFLEDLMLYLEGFGKRWPDGSQWLLDRKTNSLMVLTSTEMHRLISEMLDVIDRVPIQVRIQARFLEVRVSNLRDFGVDFPDISNRVSTIDATTGNVTAFSGRDTGFAPGTGTNLGVAASDGLNVLFQGPTTNPRFRAILRALESDDRAKLLSAPEILALNNQRAVINVSTSFDVVDQFSAISTTTATGAGGVTTTPTSFVPQSFTTVNVGFFLEVVPSVGRDMKTIVLDLHPVVDEVVPEGDPRFDRFQQTELLSPTGSGGAQSIPRPVIATRELTTKLVVEDGTIIVLGGLMQHKKIRTIKKVPFLGDIPLLGLLFRSTSDTIETTNLIIIVRATIVSPSGQTYYDPPEQKEEEEGGEGEVRVGSAPARTGKGLRHAPTLQRIDPETVRLMKKGSDKSWFVYDQTGKKRAAGPVRPPKKIRTRTLSAPEK